MNSITRIISFKYGRKNCLILLTLFLAMCTVSCGKLFVGRQVNSYTQYWCRIDTLPTSCKLSDKWFVWRFTIEEGKIENEFIFKGTADLSQGNVSGFNEILSKNSLFLLVLSNDNIVVDSINFRLRSDQIGRPIIFEKTFVFEGHFDAVSIFWKATARG